MFDWCSSSDSIGWQIPIAQSEMPADLPSQWATALQAVTHDLHVLRVGTEIDVDRLVWRIELNAEDWISIGLHTDSAPRENSIVGFLVGSGFTLDASAAQCIVWAAETVQDELAGYSYVQWPSEGGALFKPALVDGAANWITPIHAMSIPIGSLTGRGPDDPLR